MPKKKAAPLTAQSTQTEGFELINTERYLAILIKFLRKHPELRSPYAKTILMLEANPFHPSLRLHPLKGKLAGLHSVSINLSYRITIEFLIEGRTIIPINVGDHDAVY
jgi:toxin HigB-1